MSRQALYSSSTTWEATPLPPGGRATAVDAEAAVRIAETADHPLTLYFGLFGLGLGAVNK